MFYPDALCPNVSVVFNFVTPEIFGPQGNTVQSLRTAGYDSKKISGYVHTLKIGNAILITDNFVPYLVTADMITYYALKTGDRVLANVEYLSCYDCQSVTTIDEVYKVDYTEEAFIRSTKSFSLNDKKVNLGTSVLFPLPHDQNIYETTDNVFQHAPADATKMVLSIDGRAENFNQDYILYISKPNQNDKDKLTTCLLAFFHAKELAAEGKDVVLVIDSLDKMFTVFNNCMQRTGIIDPDFVSAPAVTDLESILRSSGCLKDKGTLTVIGLHKAGITDPQKHITNRFYQIFDTII